MSHISRIKTEMVEKEYLLHALDDLGYKHEEGELFVSDFLKNRTPVEIKIPVKFGTDIGFRKEGEKYQVVADWFGVHGLKRQEFVDRLMQRYAYHAAKAKLEEQGFTLVNEENQEKGQIRLLLRRMS